ncbi:hypothetical protein JW865_06885 [Candidatus Bathyarchaeota archaeon]|nr:hypothetical protein [Candidatus Bathyarchaeota archaeon]
MKRHLATSSTRVLRPSDFNQSAMYSAISFSPLAPETRLGFTESILTSSLRSSIAFSSSTLELNIEKRLNFCI